MAIASTTTPARLKILCLTGFPPSPPSIGAQRRIEGLLRGLSRRHDVTVLSSCGPEFDATAAERAMATYCEPVLVQAPPASGMAKRLLQLRSIVSTHTFEYLHFLHPAFAKRLDALLAERQFDVIQPEIHLFAHRGLRRTGPRGRVPAVVLDSHNVEYDLVRQMATGGLSPLRRGYNAINWRKLRREEIHAWRLCDGVAFTSEVDRRRALGDLPDLRTVVVANGVDTEYFAPREGDPPPDGRTLLFFGTGDYFPNRDGMAWFLREVWPRIAQRHPNARLKVVGPRPTPEVLAARGPRVEVLGRVDDLRPHIAGAAMTIVPLRIGGGTRLKVVEALAMGKAIVSTRLGAEGIEVEDGRTVLFGDDAESFASAVGRILDDPALGRRLGEAARALAVRAYSWDAAGRKLEAFHFELLDRRGAARAAGA